MSLLFSVLAAAFVGLAGKTGATRTRPTGDPTFLIGAGPARAECAAEAPRVARYLHGDRQMRNAGPASPAQVRLRRADDGRILTMVLRDGAWKVRKSANVARYTAAVRWDDQPAGTLDVVIRASQDQVTVSVENVAEAPGFELLDVTLPPLIGVRGAHGALVIPTQSGRLVPLAKAQPGIADINLDWFQMALCGAAGLPDAIAVVDTRDWDNILRAVVWGDPESRVGYFEPVFALRAEASSRAARILLATRPSFRVRLAGDVDGDGAVTWVDAAKTLRRDVRGRPTPRYRDTLFYKIYCDEPGAADFTTFEQALEVIRVAHRLAPWQKQVVYLVGWQYEGHDTGYPATDRINARLGGLPAFRRVVEEAAKLNAVVSVHDNFDDAYRSSPAFDEAVIARGTDGELRKGGVWAGGQSYILAFGKYAAHAGLERVRSTVARLGGRESYHIDVLSAIPVRRDFNPTAPENSQVSLAGKLAIVREFNRLGLDVTSEGFTAPFVGAIGHSWHLWCGRDPVFAGEERIPFIPFIYHGGPTTWSHGLQYLDGESNGALPAHYAQDCALWGAGFSTDWTRHTDPHEIARAIYLVNLPWSLLRERRMEGWLRQGSLCRVTYGADTYAEADERTGAWRVVVNGVTVGEDDLVTLRRRGQLTLFSPTARTVEVTLPRELLRGTLRARNLLTGASLSLEKPLQEGYVRLALPASEPVVVEREPLRS